MISAHEAKAEFRIEFEDGSSATLWLADPGSSLAVQDKNHPKPVNGFEDPIYASATRNLMCVSLCVPRMLAETAPGLVFAPGSRGKGP